jgi:iron complex transport system substrate-binding protein
MVAREDSSPVAEGHLSPTGAGHPSRRQVLAALGLGLAACRRSLPSSGSTTIVSLGPAVTETLFAVGAGAQVAAVSDYCDHPPEAASLPRAGTALTPNLEVLARLRPTMILGQEAQGARLAELEAIAEVHILPWYSVADLVTSVERIGTLAHQVDRARALAARLRSELTGRVDASSPRVLPLLGGPAGGSKFVDDIWFIRRNSLHGAALSAAGGRHAIDRDVKGAPALSLEGLLAVDPDFLVILIDAELTPDQVTGRYVAPWRSMTSLRAARRGRVHAIARKGILSQGPRLARLVGELGRLIDRRARE